jgi:hypothetical protein
MLCCLHAENGQHLANLCSTLKLATNDKILELITAVVPSSVLRASSELLVPNSASVVLLLLN